MDTLRKLSHYAPLTLLLMAGVCSLQSCKHDRQPSKAEAIRVTTQALGGTDTVADVSQRRYSGTIEAGTGSALSFLDGGTVRNVYVKVGDRVKKGQLLADLDNAQLTSAYDIAKAELTQAQDAYRRLKMLHDAKALADIKWVEMQSKLHQAESAAEIARKALSNTRLYAPNSGVISARMIENGMNVAPAIPVLRLVTVNDVKATINVPENEIDRFSEGMPCRLTVDGLGEKVYTARLSEKGVEADPLTREFKVKFDVVNPDSRMLPGMICSVDVTPSATVSVKSGDKDDWQPILPIRSVMLDFDNRNFVWLKKDGKAVKRYVTAGTLTPDGILITAGLQPGDSVIVDGQQKVSSGMAVTDATAAMSH